MKEVNKYYKKKIANTLINTNATLDNPSILF